MTLLDAFTRLVAMHEPAFQTTDAGAHLGIASAHASKVLARLTAAGSIVRLRRGVWAFPNELDPLALPAHLTAPFPSYVSLQSALYFHGMISQVPEVTYAVSLARTRRFRTPLGTVSIHHVDPAFFFGYRDVGPRGARIATPEKALVDFVYLRPARSKLFRALPELELPRGFRIREAQRLVSRIRSARRRTLVSHELERILAGAEAAAV